ncbi:MAG TPA: DUF5668 domain-containing protein [Patescibacteria group bacterium]|nr:DUF5668 domain-containing protein [Patescibacteria group bacterium]
METPSQNSKDRPQEIHYFRDGRRGLPVARVFFGLAILALGFYYLALNLGWLPAGLNIDFWKLWPLLIVFAGLSLLSGKSWTGGIISLVFGLLIVAVAGYIFFGNAVSTTREIRIIPIHVNTTTSTQAGNISIRIGASQLNLEGGSLALVSGELRTDFLNLNSNTENSDGVQKVDLETTGPWTTSLSSHTSELDVQLGSTVPWDVTVEGGASDMNLDLRRVLLHALAIQTGASDATVQFGDVMGETKAEIKSGASSLHLIIPKSLPARIDVSPGSGLSSRTFTGFTKINDSEFETPDYASSTKKLDLTLDLGVSNVQVIRE